MAGLGRLGHEVSIRGSLREQLLNQRNGGAGQVERVSIRGSLREQLPFETASSLGPLRASLDHRNVAAASGNWRSYLATLPFETASSLGLLRAPLNQRNCGSEGPFLGFLRVAVNGQMASVACSC
jgi:hypothetical protein